MIVAILAYKAPLETVDLHRAAHIEWLRARYADGTMLASGRQTPPTGGVLLLRATRAAAEALLAQDPFAVHDIADYTLTEFTPTMTAPGLEALAG
ncbi:YciI family protein [Sphingomonas psychrotolerans]|uniref:GTP cyclohydrolase n=1 Tax=Sphingomonas psychrotolerans TaxID=1327635 RepID=A0A2K8ML09_9SPHN|nr:YciI family protein [Sphingomonas psychrotolerans]ATY33694.1 GTP cyclohydrolase [Sphingomonas psychrotolerans]